jgi:hypothetical protein
MGAEVEYLCFGWSGNSNSREKKREIIVCFEWGQRLNIYVLDGLEILIQERTREK